MYTKATSASSPDNPNNLMTFCSLLNGTLTGYTYLGPTTAITVQGATNGAAQLLTQLKTLLQLKYLQLTMFYALADGSYVAFRRCCC